VVPVTNHQTVRSKARGEPSLVHIPPVVRLDPSDGRNAEIFKPRPDDFLRGVRDANGVSTLLPHGLEDWIPSKEAGTPPPADVFEVAASHTDSLGHLTNLAMCRRAS